MVSLACSGAESDDDGCWVNRISSLAALIGSAAALTLTAVAEVRYDVGVPQTMPIRRCKATMSRRCKGTIGP
jgi:hypothetical protein